MNTEINISYLTINKYGREFSGTFAKFLVCVELDLTSFKLVHFEN